MNKILRMEEATKIAQELRDKNKSIILVGGCFDIIHAGHVVFLNKAKQHGDILFVLLESDEKVKRLKGNNRPVNNQQDRALVLSAISSIDFVVMLPELKTDSNYDEIITKIHPSVIATTANDPYVNHKIRQAKLISGKVVYVTKRVSDQSTTIIAALTKGETL